MTGNVGPGAPLLSTCRTSARLKGEMHRFPDSEGSRPSNSCNPKVLSACTMRGSSGVCAASACSTARGVPPRTPEELVLAVPVGARAAPTSTGSEQQGVERAEPGARRQTGPTPRVP